MATAIPDAARELRLVENVQMRFALASTDKTLEDLANKFLVALLLKLASPNEEVRKKVIETCQHLNVRLQAGSISLPVEGLLAQFQNAEAGGKYPAMAQMDLHYIGIGIKTLEVEKRAALGPTILKNISSYPPTQQKRLLHFFIKYVAPALKRHTTRGSKEADEFRKEYGFEDHPEDAKWTAAWLGRFLLLSLSAFNTNPDQMMYVDEGAPPLERPLLCPGLSKTEFEFLTFGKKETWEPAGTLGPLKVAVAKFLNCGIFKEKEVFLPALMGCYDTPQECSTILEQTFKLSLSPEYLEDPEVVETFYQLVEGEAGETPEGLDRMEYSEYFYERAPAGHLLRKRILGLLERSKSAINIKYEKQIERIITGELSRDKPRKEGLSFFNWYCRTATEEHLRLDIGWVKPLLIKGAEEGNDEEVVKVSTAMLGKVYERLPDLVLIMESNGTVGKDLEWFFEQLKAKKSLGITTALTDAMTAMLPSIVKHLKKETQALKAAAAVEADSDPDSESFEQNQAKGALDTLTTGLLQMFRNVLEDAQSTTPARLMALKYTNRLFPWKNGVARMMNIYCFGIPNVDPKLREEALGGIDPHAFRLLNPEDYMEAMQVEKADDKMDIDSEKEETINLSVNEFPIFAHLIKRFIILGEGIDDEDKIGGIPVTSLSYALLFARRVLVTNALEKKGLTHLLPIDESWERKLDLAMDVDEEVRDAVRDYLNGVKTLSEKEEAVKDYFVLAVKALLYRNGDPRLKSIAKLAGEVLSLAPKHLLNTLFMAYDFLGHPITFGSTNQELREQAAYVAGLVVTAPVYPDEGTKKSLDSLSEFAKTVGDWHDKAKGATSNEAHGSITACGYVLSRTYLRKPQLLEGTTLVADVYKMLDKILRETRSTLYLEAALEAFTQLFIFNVWTPALKEDEKDTTKEKLEELAKASVPNEKAIKALGFYSQRFDESTEAGETALKTLSEFFYKLHESKSVEVHFTVAEALSVLAAGWDCRIFRRWRDMPDVEYPKVVREKTIGVVIEAILQQARSPKPSLKKASSIWLLGILEYCGHMEHVQKVLPSFHVAFRTFLSDRDELVRETASKGLSKVYELGNKDLKDDLVRDLISTFTGEKTTKAAETGLSAETELFEPGALPTGEGASVSTYGDIMSLASEVGDPSLVYKFMTLAKHNSIWSTRAAFGGKFGLSTILASAEVAENPKIYPKLFRYRFDPNPGVRRSMNDLWASIVKKPAETVEKYFREIIEDLLQHILDKEWRVREASCAAIADLIQGRRLETYGEYLEKIWSNAFKVLDDIKESVRVAAMKLCRVLTKSMVGFVKVGSGASPKDARMVLENLMPFLLGLQGIEAKAKEVQIFAFDALMKLIKGAGTSLREFIPELVPKLLGLASTLEDERVNYLHLNADKYRLTEEKIDAIRTSAISNNPIMEAAERCLDLLDEETMKRFIPPFKNTAKRSLGFPTKIGVAKCCMMLVLKQTFLTKQYADELLKTVRAVLVDRNESASMSYAGAIGYLSRIASDKEILASVEQAKKLFFENEEEKVRALAGSVVLSISKNASDRFNSLAASILPFVFIAKKDGKVVARDFITTWSENTGGSGAVKLYLTEIVQLANEHLSSPKWLVKQASAKAIASAAVAIGADITEVQIKVLYPALISAMAGRSWEGKEKVLDGYAKFLVFAKNFIIANPAQLAESKRILIREAKKTSIVYATVGMKALAAVAPKLAPDGAWYDSIADFVLPKLEELSQEPEDEDMEDADTGSNTVGSTPTLRRQQLYLNALLALASSLPPQPTAEQSTAVLSKLSASPPGPLTDNSDSGWQKGVLAVLEVAVEEGRKWDDAARFKLREVAEAMEKRVVLGDVREALKKVRGRLG